MSEDACNNFTLDMRNCRLCFDNDKLLINVFEANGCLNDVAVAIVDVLNYEVSKEDEYPPFVCENCFDKLNEFKAFKEKCSAMRVTYERHLKSKRENSIGNNAKERARISVAETISVKGILDCEENLQSEIKIEIEEQEIPFYNEDDGEGYSCLREGELSTDVREPVLLRAEQCAGGWMMKNQQARNRVKTTRTYIPPVGERPSDDQELHPEPGIHLEANYTCSHCGHISSTKEESQQHVFSTHSGNKSRSGHQCTICRKEFKSQWNLMTHLPTHSAEKRFRCHECDYSTSVHKSMQMHARIHGTEKPYKCNLCPFDTFKYIELKTHFKTHKGQKPFSCVMCGFGTSCPRELRKHVFKHRLRRPFDCVACQYGADLSKDLRKHFLETHSKDKVKFKCVVCGFSSKLGYEYRIHMREHRGKRPYKCPLCGYNTKVKDNFISHELKHLNNGVLDCDQCGYSTKDCSNMMKHVLRHKEYDSDDE